MAENKENIENLDKNTENTGNTDNVNTAENKENTENNKKMDGSESSPQENETENDDKKTDDGKENGNNDVETGSHPQEGSFGETHPNDNNKEKDELTILKEKLKEEEDKYKRLLAEFDNYRKRTEKEKISMFDFGASQILTKILPIIDNIERAIKSVKEEDKNNSVYEGLDKIYKQVNKVLEEIDVKPIEALNKKFDANLHNAVMTDEESEAEVDTITQELQKGYTYKGDVLRHSMVKVKK